MGKCDGFNINVCAVFCCHGLFVGSCAVFCCHGLFVGVCAGSFLSWFVCWLVYV